MIMSLDNDPELIFPQISKDTLKKQPLTALMRIQEWKEYTMTKSQARCWDPGMGIHESNAASQLLSDSPLWVC